MKTSIKCAIYFYTLASILIAFTLSAKFFSSNSVFAPENYAKQPVGNAGKVRRMTNETSNQSDVGNGTEPSSNTTDPIKPEPTPSPSPPTPIPVPPTPSNDTDSNSTKPDSNSTKVVTESYNINFECPDNSYFSAQLGQCIDITGNATEIMFANHTTKTKNFLHDLELTTPEIVPCLSPNKTDKYVDRIVPIDVRKAGVSATNAAKSQKKK
jgi:hypothetical protein